MQQCGILLTDRYDFTNVGNAGAISDTEAVREETLEPILVRSKIHCKIVRAIVPRSGFDESPNVRVERMTIQWAGQVVLNL